MMRLRSILFALALAACGGDAPSGDDGAVSTGDTFSGGPAGGTLIVMADREPDHLNPITFNTTPAYQVVHLMFRPLARRDSTLSGYTPDLATAWRWESDSVLVLDLRRDVFWHDGVRVTADDVVFTIEMQRDTEAGSPRQGDVAAVTHAVARDSFTVAVTLARNSLYTVNALLEVVPAPKHLLGGISAAEQKNAPFGRSPVGNSWYRFVSWNAGQNLTLVADTAKPDGRAAIDRIVLRFIPDINASMTELLTGQGDLIPKLPTSQRERLASSAEARVYNGPRVRPAWLALNTRRAPFDDVRVRRALAMAIDRESLVRGLFGEIGEVAWSPIPSALREHSPDVRPIPFDTAQAKRLLAEAGFRDTNGDGILDRNGQPFRFEAEFISSDQTRQDVLVAMQAMLRRIGVDMVPRAWESSTWVSRLRDGSFTASLWGWGYGPGVVGPNVNMVFHSQSVPPNGPNFASSRNARIDRLIEQALVATDTTQSRAIWRELEQHMIDDAVYLPIYLDPELFGMHARFRNVKFRGVEWVDDAPYWYVEPSARLPRDRARQ